MAGVLKVRGNDEDREAEFDLEFFKSLTVEQRFQLMIERSQEMARALIRHGHQRPVEIVKRPWR